MANRDLSLALRLYADAARFVSGLTQAEGGVRRFGSAAKREMDALKGAFGSVKGQLAALGVTTGAVASLMQSARMDKGLTQIGQTAGMSRAEVAKLRAELFRMGGETGQSVDSLQQGFGDLVAAGLSYRESLASIDAVNKGMAVSTATASDLANALTVAGTAFNFDLAKAGKSQELLDKMYVAGGLGSAELNNLPSIFSRIGGSAASAGMSFEQTLAFVEGLSSIEKQPERLATLADSTLRLFNNAQYMAEAAKATGVKFFETDASGAKQRRDPFAVLRDIKKEYDSLTDDKSRFMFMNRAFGKADLDTIKGVRTLLSGAMLETVAGSHTTAIVEASDATKKNLNEATRNMIDQVGRLKAVLREAADGFAEPINDTLSNVIKYGLAKKEEGGLGLTGAGILGGGAALALGTFAAARYGGMAVSGLAKRFGGTAAGVAEGKALEAAAGVTPVYVVNWPGSMGGGSAGEVAAATAAGAGAAGKFGKVAGRAKSLAVLAGGLPLSAWGTMGAAGLGTAAAGVLAAGGVGYGLGRAFDLSGRADRWIQQESLGKANGTDVIGGAIAKTLAIFGNEEARRAVAMTQKFEDAKVGGEVRIRIDQDARVSSLSVRSENPGVPLSIDGGGMMVMP